MSITYYDVDCRDPHLPRTGHVRIVMFWYQGNHKNVHVDWRQTTVRHMATALKFDDGWGLFVRKKDGIECLMKWCRGLMLRHLYHQQAIWVNITAIWRKFPILTNDSSLRKDVVIFGQNMRKYMLLKCNGKLTIYMHSIKTYINKYQFLYCNET